MSDLIERQAALDIFDDYNVSVENGELEAYRRDRKRLCDLPSIQPEPEWGLPVSINRPLSDREIIPRLREIQRQIGGSYAIDRAIELIKALAERRTDEPDKQTD